MSDIRDFDKINTTKSCLKETLNREQIFVYIILLLWEYAAAMIIQCLQSYIKWDKKFQQ